MPQTKGVVVLFLLLLVAGCSPHYTYYFLDEEHARDIPADSLKWRYSNDLVTEITVRSKDGEIMRLAIDASTVLYVRTTENDVLHFRFPTIKVEDKSEGLLGMNAVWTGYDNRQGAERTVFVREVAEAKIWSMHPAHARVSRLK